MDHRPYQSEEQIRQTIRQAVIDDPRSAEMRTLIPYIGVAPGRPPFKPGDWRTEYVALNCPAELIGALDDAVAKVQDMVRLQQTRLGQSCQR